MNDQAAGQARKSGVLSRFKGRVHMLIWSLALLTGAATADSGATDGLRMPPLNVPALREQAIQEVLTAARTQDPLLRTHAAEAAQFLGDRAVPVLQLALEDSSVPVRFAALATIGRTKIASLAPEGHRFLGHANGSIQAAAMFALHQNAMPVNLTPMASLLASDDPSVRGNAVMLVGWMGDGSAMPMLREMVQRPTARANPTRDAIVRLQFAEALARLGDAEAMVPVRAAAYSKMGEVRVLAVTIMGDVGDYKMQPAVAAMLDDAEPIELRLAAATSLAKLDDRNGQLTLLQGAAHTDPLVRAQAASGLGFLRTQAAQQALAFMLSDADPRVRLTAATGLLRQFSATP